MSSLYSMNNHHQNYGIDDTNTNYSTRQQLSDNNVNVNNSSCLPSIIDYYEQDSFHQTSSSSRSIPIYNNNHFYQDNTNQFYRYNVLSSTSSNQSK